MGAAADDRRPGRGLQRARGRRVVAVGVRDEDVRDGLAAHGLKERLDMGRRVRARIDDRDLPAADDVAAGAGEGVGPGIVGDDPAHERAHGDAGAGADREIEVEAEVGGHAVRGEWRMASSE